MTADERLSVAVQAGVADVRLNRPDKLNAVDLAMFEALAATARALTGDPAVRAVVLSGEGRGFCAGIDIATLTSPTGGVDRLVERPEGQLANLAQQAAWAWVELPVPVIAAVHGMAFGAGIQIALGADIRIVAPDAELSVMEIRWGIIPDMSGTWTLPRLVGRDVAKELTWTGRRVRGDEAVRLGLATRTADDPRAAALELAGEIAGRNPEAVRAAKRLLDRSGQVEPGEQLRAETAEISRLLGSPNQMEAVRAHFDRREPVFTDPALGLGT